eukprot:GHVS01085247.1.p1 GENE.GHVS01085247.1~~GHVS01085247.1.p1  ORF type:complete len:215 (+),score=28.63 GHVS01085247.1:226-870(+)
MMFSVLLLSFILSFVILLSTCLVEGTAYFYVTEGTDKCFLENVPQSVALTVAYDNPDNHGVACAIIFRDPHGHQVFKREVLHTSPKGKVTHLTTVAGDHRVCISCPASKWISTEQLKWTLSIELGDTDINLEQVAKKEEVGVVEGRLHKLLNLVDTISAENDYERNQQEDFKYSSETVNSRVLWFAVGHILVLSVTTLFSVFHLTRFFRTQKLI